MGDPITRRGTNFNPNPCTPQQTAANWGKVGDTVHNLQEQIEELVTIIEGIAVDVCADLAECELDLPEGFPETDPPTIENVINAIWIAIQEAGITPVCGEEEFCWECFDVVTDTDFTTEINNVVYPIDIAGTVVTDVDFDEETCELTVDYYEQSYDVWQITYVTEVTDTKEKIFAGIACDTYEMDEEERRSVVQELPIPDGTVDAADRRQVGGEYRRFS